MDMSVKWRNSYKLPVSFIVFFGLTFFLIGEQLPALPTYLLGPGAGEGGPSKVHILDLALMDGLLHRPFAYLIIGTVIWILYRIFTWPLAWFLGAVLWVLEQQTLTPLDQRKTLVNTIIFTATFWILLTLVPYFAYRWVDRRWGRQGKRNIIMIIAVINLLLFGFFAYQIFILHNSYRSSSGSGPAIPAKTCPERLVIEKGKQAMAEWEGKILPLSGEVQNWIEKNCSGALEQQAMTNSYLGVPCTSHPNPRFTYDFTEIDKILKITPPSLVANKSQDRAFLWIDTAKADKVPIYAPVDADLVRGIYKISKTVETVDYDLHFQISCEVWFFVNHISDPVDRIKKSFPSTPTDSTTLENFTQIIPPLNFKAGELIGYTKGTAQAHNFDFAVFDLNHTNTLTGQDSSNDSRFKNFICPFDLFPEAIKNSYYQKLDPSLVPESNCK